MTYQTAKKEIRERMKREDPIIALRRRAKLLDPTKTRYPWKDLIVWHRKSAWGYKFKAESPTLLYFAAIALFVVVSNYFPKDQPWLPTFFLVLIFLLPFGIEWGQRLALAPHIIGRKVAHFDIRLCGVDKTFEIHDEITQWRLVPYKSDPKAKSSEARHRAGLQIEFKHHFQIGAVDNPHIFNKLTIFGSTKYMRGIDNLCMNHRSLTDIFGVLMDADVYIASFKTDEKSWNEAAGQFACASWATRETGSAMEIKEPFIVVSREDGVYDCPHCGMAFSRDELIAMDRYAALQFKSQKIQAQVRADYSREKAELLAESDFKGWDEKEFHQEYWKVPWSERLRPPKLKAWQWVVVVIVGIALAAMLSPSFRLMLREFYYKLGGGP